MATPPARRVGLSKLHPTQRLLQSAKPSAATTTTTTTTPKPEPKLRGGRSRLKVPDPVPEDIFAPPLASSDSEDDEAAGIAEADEESSRPSQLVGDSSDTDTPLRGAISSTNFTSLSDKEEPRGRRATKTKSQPSIEPDQLQNGARKRKRASDVANDKTKSKKNAPPRSSSSHFTDEHGFVKQARVKATFGKKGASSQESRKSRASEEASTAKFRPPPEFNNETPRKSSKFIVPDDAFSSPTKSDLPSRLHIQHDDDSDTDDDTAVFSQPKSLIDDTEFAAKIKPKKKRKGDPLLPNKRNATRKKEEEKKEEPAQVPSSPAAKFVIPAQLSDFQIPKTTTTAATSNGGGDDIDNDLSDGSSGLSSLGSLFPDKDGEEEQQQEGGGGSKALCPWCGAAVDMKQLTEFSKGKRLNVRKQTEFCEAHKKKSAIVTWESKAYPKVAWASLEKRFGAHRARLLSIINGGESHYRAVLADKIELGQARSINKDENLNPGYYGPRGFNMMCDYLVLEFSDMLKKKAIHDKVIAGRGPSIFIQSVLVAELGVQLIMEDMHVSQEEARDILEESKALGDLVHAEN